jgi:hypothetical protein
VATLLVRFPAEVEERELLRDALEARQGMAGAEPALARR